MLLGDDDEIQKVDSTYLGPPGKYIGRIRYRTAGFFVVLVPVLLFVVDKMVGISFWPVVWTLIFSVWFAGWLADNLTTNRPLTGSLVVGIGEVGTPRSDKSATHVRGPARIRVYERWALSPSIQRPARSREL